MPTVAPEELADGTPLDERQLGTTVGAGGRFHVHAVQDGSVIRWLPCARSSSCARRVISGT